MWSLIFMFSSLTHTHTPKPSTTPVRVCPGYYCHAIAICPSQEFSTMKWQRSNWEPAISQVPACPCFQSRNEQNLTSPYLAFLGPENSWSVNVSSTLTAKSVKSRLQFITFMLSYIRLMEQIQGCVRFKSFTKSKMAHGADIKEFHWSRVHTGCIIADDVGSWWWAEASRYTMHMADFIEVQIKVICGGTLKSRTCRFDLQRQMSWQYGDNTTNIQPLLYGSESGDSAFRTLQPLHTLCTFVKPQCHLLIVHEQEGSAKKVFHPVPSILSCTSGFSVSLL